MKTSGIIRVVGFLIAVGSLVSQAGGATLPSLPPVLPLDTEELKIDFWNEILKDDYAEIVVVTDASAERAENDIRKINTRLKSLKGQAREPYLKMLYRNLAGLNLYLNEVVHQRVKSPIYMKKAQFLLPKTRRELAKVATEYVALAKDQKAQALATFYAQADAFFAGDQGAVSEIIKVKNDLPRELKLKVAVLGAAFQGAEHLSQGSVKELVQAKKILKGPSAIAVNFLLARHEASLGHKGYRRLLHEGLTMSEILPRATQISLLKFAVKTWRTTEPSAPWSHPPVPVKQFNTTLTLHAIAERALLADLTKGETAKFLDGYRKLSDALNGEIHMAALDKRIIQVEQAIYRSKGDYKTYELALVTMVGKYAQASLVKKHPAEFGEAKGLFEHEYRSFTFAMLDKADANPKNFGYVQDAVGVAYRYIAWTPVALEKVQAKEKVVHIYASGGQHKAAVGVLDDLIATGPKEKLDAYLALAINSQSQVAQWPKEPPFKNIPKDQVEGREKLLGYYGVIQKRHFQWHALAHIGLLNISLGRMQQGFDIWTAGLEKDGRGMEASLASAMMLVSYHGSKLWQRLETLTDICLKGKIEPQGFGVRSLEFYLADALYFGGKEHFTAKNYKGAWPKFERFNNNFKTDPRRDETLYLVGYAYRGDRKFVDSIQALYAHSQEYPASGYRIDALLKGGQWSTDMALEEYMVYFFQTFVNENERHQVAPKIRDALVHAYMGMGHYGDAGRIYRYMAESNDLPLGKRVGSALAIMEIEEKYGQKDLAEWGANKALELTKTPAVVSEVLAFRARQAIKKPEPGLVLEALLQSANGLDMTHLRVQENVGAIRYFYAETKALREPDPIFNLTIENHHQVIEQKYAKFLATKKYYDDVCAVGRTSFCAPALQRISQMTEVSIKTIEEVKIQDILQASAVNSFNQRKNMIIGYLTKVAMTSAQKAYKLANSGLTDPEYAHDINWENSNEWNFNQAEGAVGNTYLQWSTTQHTKAKVK